MVSLNNYVDEVLKEFTKQNFISIFFIAIDLMSRSPSQFLEIVENDRNFMEKSFKELLNEINYEKNLLIEIFGTIKKYQCVRLLGCCRHIFLSKNFPRKLNKFWTFLYEICELLREEDFKCLETLFPCVIQDDVCPEVLLVKAYQQKIFTKKDLTKLSKAFKDGRPDISKLLDDYNDYNEKEFYPVATPSESSPCGLAVIVNHVEFKSDDTCVPLKARKDSLLDVEALKNLWIKFGFKVSIHIDLTDVEVLELFESLAKEDHSSYDVFVTCYLSHGEEGVVFGSNCKPIPISKLEDIMANQCLTLMNKPKLFFIQACQGRNCQQGVFSETISLQPKESSEDTSRAVISSHNPNVTPLFSDVLTVVSTIQGYVSFGFCGQKTWFIDSLVTNMEKYGHERTMYEIVNKVNYQVKEKKARFKGGVCKQTSIMYSTLCRNLLLKKIQ